MRGFSEILSRANIQQIQSFLLYGVETYSLHEKSREQIIQEIENKIYETIKSKTPDTSECDEIMNDISVLEFELENAYMELGLKCGINIGMQMLKDN